MKNSKRITLTILALIGFITSIKLSVIYIDANFNPYALSSFCSINDLIDCDGVAKTTHSQFFGVPLAFWGLFLYFIFLFFTYVDKLQNIQIKGFKIFGFTEVFRNPESYICALGVIAFFISMVLAGISLFEIHKICILCFFTYILNLVIGLFAKPADENYLTVFKTSFLDFIDALKIKKYLIAFTVVLAVAVGILSYTTLTDVLAPQVKLEKDMKKYSSSSGDEYKISGNILGDPKAVLVVHEYTDYQCPFCFVLNTMLLRAVNELSDIKVVHHNLPLDKDCNPTLDSQMHPGSCKLAKYVIAAGMQGKYWDMNNLLFDQKEDEYTNEEILLKDAKKLGLDIEKLKTDANSKETSAMLKKEIDEAINLGIDGTPAIRINMETHVGIIPYEELKAKLIKAGAKERK